MIALTQEKREELKAFLSASIKNRCTVYTLAKQRELEVLRDQIALASITSQPVSFFGNGAYYNTANAAIKDGAEGIIPLYDAPPVLEIKIPDLLDIPDGLDLASAMAAINWYEMETKRLNGLGE